MPLKPIPSFAQSPDGRLYVANGVDEVRRRDGYSSFQTAGLDPPSNVPTISSSGTGNIVGTYFAYQRYLDADGLASNLSPISLAHTTDDTTGDIANATHTVYTGAITAATNATPIVITSADHNMNTNNRVKITGVLGNTAANGEWLVTVINANTFSLNGSVGNGAYTEGGIWERTGAPIVITSIAHGLVDDDVVQVQDVAGNYTANGNWTVTKIDDDRFSLNDSIPVGTYLGGGTWKQGVDTITYANLDAPTESRVTKRQILRNKDGDASVFYVDVETTNLAATTFNSTNVDDDLGDEVVLLDLNNNDINLSCHAKPPSFKTVMVHHQGRMWLTSDIDYRDGACILTNGSSTVTGIGTAWTSDMVGLEFWPNDSTATTSYVISTVNTGAQTLTISSNYGGTSNAYARYAIRPGGEQRRTIYFSESALPESWNLSLALTMSEDPRAGEVKGLMPMESWLMILSEHRIDRLTFKARPATDGFVFKALDRGVLNQRCWVQVEGAAYILDRQGIYAYFGNQEEQIAMPIQPIFADRPDDRWSINWTNTEYFHAVHDPLEEVIKFFVCLSGSRFPYHALCYQYRHKRWWIEEYPVPIISSCLGLLDGRQQVFLGSSHRRVFAASQGYLDGVAVGAGTIRGTVTSSSIVSLSDTSATFHSSCVGAPVRIVEGTGYGQSRIIVAQTSTKLTVKDPWTIQPDTTSVYQVGGIRWRYKTGFFQFAQTQKNEKRGLEVIFKPTEDDSRMAARVFTDDPDFGLDQAVAWRVSSPAKDASTFSNEADGEYLVADTTKRSGHVRRSFDDIRMARVDGPRYVSVELEGVPNSSRHKIREVRIDGATAE